MTSKMPDAIAVALEQHAGQVRKCSQAPYIVHLLDVAKHLISEPGVHEDIVVAGILHDTLEDTDYTAEQLEKAFGTTVRKYVEFNTEMAKDNTSPETDKRKTWRLRKEHTIKSCETASREELLILLADKLSNLQALKEDLQIYGDSAWDCFNASKDNIAWYYRALRQVLADRLGETRMFRLLDPLMDEVFGS